MSSELKRVHNKINYETNVVDPKTFAVLLSAVEKNQPLTYTKGRDEVFPNARAKADMQWNIEKPDTHASGTLEQYGLVNAAEDRTITVSDLGYRFLRCFDHEFNMIEQDDYYKTILIEMIISWVELENNRNIHPGRILLKLMLDPELQGYHTNNEFALWTSDECAMTDSDYDKIKQLIINYRNNPIEVKPKKAEVFLRPFANSWGLFDRTIKDQLYTFTIKESVLPLVKQFFIYINCSNIDNKNEYDDLLKDSSDENYMINEQLRVLGGCNILLYGVPGAGKSYTIAKDYCDDEERMERLVFHPDYTYSDFIGQILPKVKGETVSYEFTPGPFTNLVKKAYNNPDKEYFLIIEEINRGNAPAIFGDIFQLLDRNEKGDSEYSITNVDMARIIYSDENRKVCIPSNMSIIGTMNTSDQNVFTLDTAFQRRWNMRMIENNFSNVNEDFANQTILDTNVTWKDFCTTINDIILRKNVCMTSSEDKRLGVYFVNKNDLIYDNRVEDGNISENERIKAKINNARFPEKVLKYLWDDVFKFSRQDIFEVSEFISLESVIKKFTNEKGNERFSIFKEDVYNAIANSLEENA